MGLQWIAVYLIRDQRTSERRYRQVRARVPSVNPARAPMWWVVRMGHRHGPSAVDYLQPPVCAPPVVPVIIVEVGTLDLNAPAPAYDAGVTFQGIVTLPVG